MYTFHQAGPFELRMEEENPDIQWHASRTGMSILLTYRQFDIDTGHF
jgi:hypothetical protein